ncbi:pyrroline-5-carboxylate reductase [Candidatus Albibeggiatoa sp. nov. NOAA]|uniref:pyrroline-5-carboxylate reductase n=1 Tax=Candidatus Albibeggiatoa sp. nov. NOAA TaxID=3162724 RepID=UPI0032FE3E6A|nr:pyrroline-5-carboxylate reductase [Thiotrichaceae bacterium]
MQKSKISFIGGGNMAASIINGLLQADVPAEHIRVADPSDEPLAAQFPVECVNDNLSVLEGADVVILAVKPQILADVSKSLATALSSEHPPLFISIAAGIQLEDLARWLGVNKPLAIVRVMPNTPSLVQSGASALFAGEYVSNDQKDLAESILRAVGLTLWLDNEADMDAVTALSGSGPAYFFLLMEVMEKAGIQLGLSQETSRLLTLQTAFGAAKMALESNEDAATLRTRVMSKGGTTEQAINVLNEGGVQELFDKALHAARDRATEIAKQFGEQ